jgi:hypothetical protein
VSVLESEWDLIESPSLLPTLQQLAKKPLKDPGSNDSSVYTTRELKSIALERWYEVDPGRTSGSGAGTRQDSLQSLDLQDIAHYSHDSARQEAIRQIGSAHASMTAESLYFFENESLPQFGGSVFHQPSIRDRRGLASPPR